MQVNIAAIQMTSGPQVERNLQSAEAFVAQAASMGADLIVLPENFAVFDSAALFDFGERETHGGYFSTLLAAWAARYNVWLVGGTLPCRQRLGTQVDVPGRRVRTRSMLFSPQGVCTAAYDKIHLFDVDVADSHGSYRESDTIEPGDQPVLATLPWGKLGLTVCYDLRFPELYCYLQMHGATVITVPAAFTYVTGQAHWFTLLRARAIETQCFIVAPNQCGENRPNRRTWGHSCIVSPWGDIVAMQEDGEGIVQASIDMAELEAVRQKMPLQQHKRFTIDAP